MSLFDDRVAGKKIGSGFNGTVYEHKDSPHHVIKETYFAEQEARKLRRMSHPRVPGVVGNVEKRDGTQRMIMEKKKGVPIYNALKRNPEDAKKMAGDMFAVTRDIHENGIGHGDLNAGNMLWDHDNQRINVIDFGESNSDKFSAYLEAMAIFNPNGNGLIPAQGGKFANHYAPSDSQGNRIPLEENTRLTKFLKKKYDAQVKRIEESREWILQPENKSYLDKIILLNSGYDSMDDWTEDELETETEMAIEAMDKVIDHIFNPNPMYDVRNGDDGLRGDEEIYDMFIPEVDEEIRWMYDGIEDIVGQIDPDEDDEEEYIIPKRKTFSDFIQHIDHDD
jgi:serine/threonine protein kinase